jgi:hypothetical protein
MTLKHDTDIPAIGPADLERAPAPDVKDVRKSHTRDDRSAHRAHAWLYDDLLA